VTGTSCTPGQLYGSVAQLGAWLEIAGKRMLTLEDVDLTTASGADAVRERCDLIAADVARRYLSGSLEWANADTCANHIYDLMILHCDSRPPTFAWDVFLAFDEGEIKNRGDGHTRPRVAEILRKHGAAS